MLTTPHLNGKATIENRDKESPLEVKIKDYRLFDCHVNYISCMNVYFAYYNVIPSMITIRGINMTRVQKWVETTLAAQIRKKHYKSKFWPKTAKADMVDSIYLLKDRLLIDLEQYNAVHILFTQEQEEKAMNLVAQIRKFTHRQIRTRHISMVVNKSTEGLTLVDVKNKKPKLQVPLNYNQDLVELHITITRELRKNDNSGLFLFHGAPGTGKSTYIRYLVNCVNKKVIFLPPKMARNLDSPDLIKLLLDNPNSIFVIEDAEDLIASRDKENNSSISMLLNLTDGLLGESLGIQVICTFNTHLNNIDKALLRKGRLTALYEFKPLAIEKAKALLEQLGVKEHCVTQPMTLADIYNITEQDFKFTNGTQRSIGFGVQV